MNEPLLPTDPAHYETLADEEFDRMRDEHDERLERADRYDEKGPTPFRFGPQHQLQQED